MSTHDPSVRPQITAEQRNPYPEGEDPGDATPVDPDPEPQTIHATVTGWAVADRRPIVPAWARNRTEARQLVGWLSRYGLYVLGYHATRIPKYVVKVVCCVPLGVVAAVVRPLGWVFDAEGAPLRRDAVGRGDVSGYMTLSRQRNLRTKHRGVVAGAVLLALAVSGVLVAFLAPGWVQTVLVVAGVLILARLGRPADVRITDPVVTSSTAPPRLTADVVTRALQALGISAMTAKGATIGFPAPITRDGPGWRADVDLPHGVTVTDVVERRDRLASGLRRPLGCVWPDVAAEQHAGRLVLWVGDQPLSQVRPPVWPLRKQGAADVFAPLPFGTDQRGRPVGLPLIESNLLIGSLPGAGKTAALRCVLLGAALDPSVELHCWELKGSGDLESLERVAHAYGSGVDDDTIGECLAGLRALLGELERRAATLKRLRTDARDLVPDSKVTRQLADRRSLSLWPIVFSIDEAQELFAHPTYGGEAGDLATKIIKRGRALGIVLILATQRPDKDSLPTGVSANVGIRFCLRVMGQVENDMILGTSAYKNGLRSTMFTRSDRGIGYLVGAADAPTVTRAYYLDATDSDAVIARAHAAREAAGLLTGQAAGEDTRTDPTPDLLADVRAVLTSRGGDRVWHEDLLDGLAELRPDTYSGWDVRRLGTELRALGVPTRQVGETVDGERVNRRGVRRSDLEKVLAGRPERAEIEP